MDGWKDVPGFPPYQAHPDGLLRRKETQVPCGRDGTHLRTIKAAMVIGHVLTSTGYRQVMLPGRRKMTVHRMIALTFCDGYAPGLVVNHKNGNKIDNRAANLEWVTHSENNLHAFRELGRKSWTSGVRSGDHPTSKAVVATNLVTGEVRVFACAMDAVRAIPGLDSGSISRCCYGEYASHKGYAFKFHAIDAHMEAA